MPEQRLVRSETDVIVAGVCGGIAAYLGIDSVFVRLAFLLLLFSGGVGLPLYIALAIIMPTPANVDQPSSRVLQDNVDKLGETVSTSVERLQANPRGPIVFAIFLIGLGLYLVLRNLGWVSFNLSLLGPVLLILLGAYLLLGRQTG